MFVRLFAWCAVSARVALVAALWGCTPALDWREVRPEGSGVIAWFPCKPMSESRTVKIGEAQVRMTVSACRATGATYGLAFFSAGDPAQVGPMVAAWRAATAAPLSAALQSRGELRVPGMTPNPHADRVSMAGTLPDGQVVLMESGYFVKGLRVYRATVSGTRPSPDAVQFFFDGLKLAAD